MARQYLALAMLASALWGVSYPITYLALRFFSINELIMLSYLFSILLLLMVLMFHGYDGKSIAKGLLLSPINYVITYLYTALSHSVGGLTALVSSSYVVLLIVIDYIRNRIINVRYIVSESTLLIALYLLFQGYGDSIYVASLLMFMNLVYTIALALISNADALNFVFGQSTGVFLITCLTMHGFINTSSVLTSYLYYPFVLALVGNVIPYALYALSIRHIGPVETSLTSSVETISSLISSTPIQQLPINPVAWMLLMISILSLNIENKKPELRTVGLILPSNCLPTQLTIEGILPWNKEFRNNVGVIYPHIMREIPGKRKII